jgi:hypothetical protein
MRAAKAVSLSAVPVSCTVQPTMGTSATTRGSVRRAAHRLMPFSRAPKHARRLRPAMMNPAPQMPHFDSPENRY